MAGFTHESTINESIEWYTPPEIFTAMDVEFDLDPCSPGEDKSFVPAKRHLTIVDDGLASSWDNDFVFMNPPHGKNTPVWMNKFARHGNGIALVFARTDVKWFQDNVNRFSAVCFVSGRIKFFKGSIYERGGTPGTGSMLIACGEHAKTVLENSGLGVVMQVST